MMVRRGAEPRPCVGEVARDFLIGRHGLETEQLDTHRRRLSTGGPLGQNLRDAGFDGLPGERDGGAGP